MRKLLIVSSLLALSGCTALAIGGAGVVGYQLGKDERPPGVVTSDAAITTSIKSKYVADDVVSVFTIHVRTYEATVTLSGTVGSIAARRRAETLARETDGVKAVNNQIIIEDQSK